MAADYCDQKAWNAARGRNTSPLRPLLLDRTISDYAREVWRIEGSRPTGRIVEAGNRTVPGLFCCLAVVSLCRTNQLVVEYIRHSCHCISVLIQKDRRDASMRTMTPAPSG